VFSNGWGVGVGVSEGSVVGFEVGVVVGVVLLVAVAIVKVAGLVQIIRYCLIKRLQPEK
jgi:hypothetical protein